MNLKTELFRIFALTCFAALAQAAQPQTDYRLQPRSNYVPLKEFQGVYVSLDKTSFGRRCSRFRSGERVEVALDLTERKDGRPELDTRDFISPTYMSLLLTYGDGRLFLPFKLAPPSKGKEDVSGIWVHDSKRRALISGYLAPREIYSFNVSKRGLVPFFAGLDIADYEIYVGQMIERSKDGQTLTLYGMDHVAGKAGGFPLYPKSGFMSYPSPSLKRRAQEICVLQKI